MSTRRAEAGETLVAKAPYGTPWGEGAVVVGEGRLLGVLLPGRTARLLLEAPETETGDPRDPGALTRWVAELEAYFAGRRLSWAAEDVGLDELPLNDFERAVHRALLSVPPGETVGYGELAEMAGHPRAARAVGNVMASNPVPVVLPCHRVIRADGSLGRYGDDPEWKKRLLAHERAARQPGSSEPTL